MFQSHGYSIRLQADDKVFRNRYFDGLHGLICLAAARASGLIQGAMDQATEIPPQLLSKTQRDQLPTDIAARRSDIMPSALKLLICRNPQCSVHPIRAASR